MERYNNFYYEIDQTIQKTKANLTCIMFALDNLENYPLYYALQDIDDKLTDLAKLISAGGGYSSWRGKFN